MRNICYAAAAGVAISLAAPGWAGVNNVKLDTSPDRVKTPLKVDFKRIGTLKPRSCAEIRSSNWTIGCETLDRDYCVFSEYREYLGPLGIKNARLQAGWWKCEKVKGVYDFRWLDEIVDSLRADGIDVFMELSYGNPNYEGGGGWDLAAGYPTGEIGFGAWSRWVAALVDHFKDRVRTYCVWNEPDIVDPATPGGPSKKTPGEIAKFNVRTARIVREHMPEATIAGLALARNDPKFLDECLAAMGEDVTLFDQIVYHGYQPAPETSYENVEEQKEVVAKYNPKAVLRQGENGCPSEMTYLFALRNIPWSEYSQAKWDMRRMLGDLGHDVLSHVFTISDFNHTRREVNLKGLVRADSDRRTVAIKRAYYAVQNVASVFDDRLRRVKDGLAVANPDRTLQLYEYRTPEDRPVIVFWRAADEAVYKGQKMTYVRPGDSFETSPSVFDYTGRPLAEPVWVDLLTGRIYEIPQENCKLRSGGCLYVDIPVYDSPCLLTERKILMDRSAARE